MIQFLSVTKNYGKFNAVSDVSFEINEGEFVFLVGHSGSGKTTLIKMLIREESPSEGKIFFHDYDVTKFKRNQVYQLRRKIGVIFQDFKLIPEMNAYENVAFAMQVAGRTEKEIKEHVPYLLDIVGLSSRMEFFPKQLSGGEQQRVAIARAISNNPKLLIADEPTGNLDPESAWDIVQVLSKINNWGTTVLMSTHGSDIVNSLHKRVLKMENGKLIKDDKHGSYEEQADLALKVRSNIVSITIPQEVVPVEENEMKAEDVKPEETITTKKEEKKNISKKKKKDNKAIEEEPAESKEAETAVAEKVEAESETSMEDKILEKFEQDKLKDSAEKSDKLDTKTPIKDLKLPNRTKNKLKAEGFKNLSDLIEAGSETIEKLDGITSNDFSKISKLLADYE